MTQKEELPDKGYLYGMYQRGRDWREKLHRQTAHKALDIGVDDDMFVDNSKRSNGFGWKELAVLAATAVGGGYLLTNSTTAPPMPTQQAVPSPIDSEYEVLFFDRDGRPISIPHISQKAAQ